MLNVGFPKEFKKNYLTQQNAMKIAGVLSGDLFTNIAESQAKRALISMIENVSNRSLADCMDYVEKIPDSKLIEFVKKARKFVR